MLLFSAIVVAAHPYLLLSTNIIGLLFNADIVIYKQDF
jgi:hypothetical protein